MDRSAQLLRTSPPDFWRDLASTVDRAGGDPDRLWLDDSKRILHRGKGRDRLDATCLALLDGVGQALPHDAQTLFAAVGAGTVTETELARWLDGRGHSPPWPAAGALAAFQQLAAKRPLQPAGSTWRLVSVRSVILGPELFNYRLGLLGSKARVHFTAFRELLEHVWQLATDGRPTEVESDKHGGRHYYFEPLLEVFPETWIDRGPEGPELSRYTLRSHAMTLELSLSPRAERSNGLVALASMVSKCLREAWMDVFNGYWTARVAGLKPTAGYPVDALRFRRAIEPLAEAGQLDTDLWWRRK
ncbi:MAG: hypothetical protein JO161_10185 [Planctomycetaceae bacterium]|nr:hypothetical protein [Planctomycetaceae bacterium]